MKRERGCTSELAFSPLTHDAGIGSNAGRIKSWMPARTGLRRNGRFSLAPGEAKKLMAFQVPAEVPSAADTAARNDLTSGSYVCRRALVNELRERGLLTENA